MPLALINLSAIWCSHQGFDCGLNQKQRADNSIKCWSSIRQRWWLVEDGLGGVGEGLGVAWKKGYIKMCRGLLGPPGGWVIMAVLTTNHLIDVKRTVPWLH